MNQPIKLLAELEVLRIGRAFGTAYAAAGKNLSIWAPVTLAQKTKNVVYSWKEGVPWNLH